MAENEKPQQTEEEKLKTTHWTYLILLGAALIGTIGDIAIIPAIAVVGMIYLLVHTSPVLFAGVKKIDTTKKPVGMYWFGLWVLFFGALYFDGGVRDDFISAQYEINEKKLGEEKAEFIKTIQEASSDAGEVTMYQGENREIEIYINTSAVSDTSFLTQAENVITDISDAIKSDVSSMVKDTVKFRIGAQASGDKKTFIWVVSADYNVKTISNFDSSKHELIGSFLDRAKKVTRSSNTNTRSFITSWCESYADSARNFCYLALN